MISLLVSSLITWLNMNHVDYSPHSDLTPNTHYLLGINSYQPFLLLTCLLMTAWFLRASNKSPKDYLLPITGILLLNLLGLPMIFTPWLLPHVNWQLSLLIGIIIAVVFAGILTLINFLGNKITWQLNYRSLLNRLKQICQNFWPILLTFLILWLITLGSFAILWDGKFTMVQWMLTERPKIITVNVLIIFAIALILMAITNRWWLSSGITILFYLCWLGASILKIAARNEPIIPTDISTLTAPSEMLGMVNKLSLIHI